jgi:hypothetical protein
MDALRPEEIAEQTLRQQVGEILKILKLGQKGRAHR